MATVWGRRNLLLNIYVFAYGINILKCKISIRIHADYSTIWAAEGRHSLSHVSEYWLGIPPGMDFFVYKGKIWSANCTQARKCWEALKTQNVSTQGRPPIFGLMSYTLPSSDN